MQQQSICSGIECASFQAVDSTTEALLAQGKSDDWFDALVGKVAALNADNLVIEGITPDADKLFLAGKKRRIGAVFGRRRCLGAEIRQYRCGRPRPTIKPHQTALHQLPQAYWKALSLTAQPPLWAHKLPSKPA